MRACLFDLDGVLTQTARVDSCRLEGVVRRYLRERAARKGERFVAFDPVADYDEYLDGKPRYDRSPGDAPAEQQAGRAVITEGYSL